MDEREIFNKISEAKLTVLLKYPFFGRLLLRLRFGTANCKTAFTDMRRIVFDPQFANRLSQEEIVYVLIHEVLHCALKHCTRGAGKQHFIYNVACDIVVNSIILKMFDRKKLMIDGENMMHTAPDGKEGREYSAEEVYMQLLKMSLCDFERKYGGGEGIDCHDVWGDIEDTSTVEDLWKNHLKEAAGCSLGSGIPDYLERYLKEVESTPRTNWRQLLHDFIQFDTSDYDFTRPDKRYLQDVILPSFCEDIFGSRVEKIWFFVDTSGSITDEAVATAYDEIKNATEQIGNLSGMVSFFDAKVSEPIAFDSFDDLRDVKPIGGGGTSFFAVFEKLKEYEKENGLPNAIIIITDGFAPFPKEEAALGVPVIWLITDSSVTAPWGVGVYISS